MTFLHSIVSRAAELNALFFKVKMFWRKKEK